jgi:hypothetical protein
VIPQGHSSLRVVSVIEPESNDERPFLLVEPANRPTA